MKNFNDYYEILGVEKQATYGEIKKAYRMQMKKWHPDSASNNYEDAEQMTKQINEAYETLKNPRRREIYDISIGIKKSKKTDSINEENIRKSMRRSGKTFKDILDKVVIMYKILKDSMAGKYKVDPLTTGKIIFALLYLVIPTDVILDYIPFIGYLDDVAVVGMIIAAIYDEIEKYENKEIE